MCDKTDGVKTIIAGGEVTNKETEYEIRHFVENYTDKKNTGFPHLCPEHFLYVSKRIVELRKKP